MPETKMVIREKTYLHQPNFHLVIQNKIKAHQFKEVSKGKITFPGIYSTATLRRILMKITQFSLKAAKH